MNYPYWNSDRVGERSGTLCAATLGVNARGIVFPVRCKSWDCPICAPINALHWAIRIRNGLQVWIDKGVPVYFLTITSANVKTASFAWSILDNQWDKLRNRVQYRARKEGKKFDYCNFVEVHESGIPHLHTITNYPIDTETLKTLARKSGFGYQCKAEQARSAEGLAWYVSKYCTKTSQKQGMPKGTRRIRPSQDFPLGELDVDKPSAETCVVRQYGESIKAWLGRVKAELPSLDLKDVLNQVSIVTENALPNQDAELCDELLELVHSGVTSTCK